MRRAKLAPAALPPGSLPPTSWYKIPRCFVCDETIKSHRLSTSLLAGRTQFSHSPLPTKIGGYIGDQFVVVVTAQDALCKHCMALINTMDRLEQELRQHQSTLLQHLKTKYRLDGNADAQGTFNEMPDGENEEKLVEEVDEEWKPSKRQKTETAKQHRCVFCNASFTNLSLFMAHLKRHKPQDKPEQSSSIVSVAKATSILNSKSFKPCPTTSSSSTLHLEEISQSVFKCGCCTELFSRKDKLAEHMQVHTSSSSYSSKTTNAHTKASIPSKLESTSILKQNASESSIQASALFQDLDQLPQPEVDVSPIKCTEEQKGRVCLLALLNNGVCTDLSHRDPATSLLVSMSSDSPSFNTEEHSSVTVTVSIPSDLSFENSFLSTLTSDLSASQADSVCVSDGSKVGCPVESQNENVVQQNIQDNCSANDTINKNLTLLDHSNSSLDMPNLNDNSLQHNRSCEQLVTAAPTVATTMNKSDWANFNQEEELVKEKSSKEPLVSKIQDMSHLLLSNDVHISQDGSSCGGDDPQKNNARIQIDSYAGIESNSGSVVDSSIVSEERRTSTYFSHPRLCDASGKYDTMTQEMLDLKGCSNSDAGQGETDSMNNIAIVSVMSVQVNSVNYESENIPSEWCYSDSEAVAKDKGTEEKLLFHHVWQDTSKDNENDGNISNDASEKLCVSKNCINENETEVTDSTTESESIV